MGITSIVIAAATFENKDKVVDYLIIAVWCFIALYVVRYFTMYFLYHTELAPFWLGVINERSFHSFTNPRFLNQVQSWVMPLALAIGWYYWIYKKESSYRWVMPLLLGVWLAFIIDTGGRGTALGISAGFLVILFLYIKNKSGFLMYNLAIIAISYGINYLFLDDVVEYKGRSLERISSSGRLDNWMELLPEIFSQPLLGYGPMHYASLALENSWGHPHNWFLQFSYEWGLVVSIVVAYIFFSSIFRFGNHIKTGIKPDTVATKMYWVKIGLLWSLIAATIHGLVSGIIVMPMSQMWFVLIVGISLGIYLKEKKHSFDKDTRTHKLAKLILILISIGALSGIVIWGTQHPVYKSKANYQKYESLDTEWKYPRYWGLGKF
ncbi:MAG: O-antigen ligase family protein [Balneolaceae bacterium]|nr:O-antigen ligase family protein [Balneolaceae bacterium]